MIYLIIGLVAIVIGCRIVVIIWQEFAKVSTAASKTAYEWAYDWSYGTGSLSGRFVRRVARFLSRSWVEIELAPDLEQLGKPIEDAKRNLRKLERWEPKALAGGLPRPATFEGFRLPEARNVGTAVHLRELDIMCEFTSPAPSAVLAALARRECSYPGPEPTSLNRERVWPKSLNPIRVELPTPRCELLTGGVIRRWIFQKGYARELSLVAKSNEQLSEIARELESVNGFIEEANAALVLKRENYEAEFSRLAAEYAFAKEAYATEFRAEKVRFSELLSSYEKGESKAVVEYFSTGLRLLSLPSWFSTKFDVGLDETGGALIVDVELPNLIDVSLTKTVVTATGRTNERFPNRKESLQARGELHPLSLLLIACELARMDTKSKLDLIAVNGWVSYRSRSTGQPQTAYVASLIGSPEELLGISLPDVEPLTAFRRFRGQSAFVVDDVVPIRPQLALNRDDPRFIAGRQVIAGLDSQTNLATMDWQDFEHLIRELFERLYNGKGVEVKVTQASRDRGVDAVVLDPDPIRGGKTVIQAKRYMNTVDVSAVRDLYGTVHNEGASRGILVTTSNYGPDAYQFVEGKPLTLINGSQLLAYLKETGKSVRIDLEEARRLAQLQS